VTISKKVSKEAIIFCLQTSKASGWKCEKRTKKGHQVSILKIPNLSKVKNQKTRRWENETVFGRKVYPVIWTVFNIDQIEGIDSIQESRVTTYSHN